MKIKILLIIYLIPAIFFSQTDDNSEIKEISGFVKHKNKPLQNVKVFVEETSKFAITDSIGFYKVYSKVGGVISFNYFGFKKTSILIEDITTILNINMRIDKNKPVNKRDNVLKLGGSSIGAEYSNFR